MLSTVWHSMILTIFICCFITLANVYIIRRIGLKVQEGSCFCPVVVGGEELDLRCLYVIGMCSIIAYLRAWG